MGLKKQVSIFVPLEDWRLIRLEAARLKITMTQLCLRYMNKDMTKLRNQ